MKPRTFIYMVVGLALAFGLFWVLYANASLLAERFLVWRERTIPLYAALGIVFLLGLSLALGFTLVRESHHLAARWRQQREQREARKVDELYGQGIESMLDGSPATALESFRAVLAHQPRRVDALLKAGELLRVQDRPDEAAELHLRAHHAAPEDLRPLYELVTDAETRHDSAGAKRYLEQIIELKPKTALPAYRHLRDIHMREGAWESAIEIQERLDKVRPAGSDEEADDARIRVGIRYERAAQRADGARPQEAVGLLKRLLKDHPAFVPAWKKLGTLRGRLDGPEAAVSTWTEGYAATSAPVLLTALEDHFLAAEQPDRAIEFFRQAVASATNDAVPHFFLGKLFYRLEMLDEALAELTSLQDRASYSPALAYTLARIHERRDRPAEANEYYRQIVREQDVSAQYRCLECRRRSNAWHDRCPACGQWNAIEIDFRENVSLEELGISTAPVYTARRA
ncbi:MAG: tetratricopeptide repeat protein [Rhodospirillales bacterium]